MTLFGSGFLVPLSSLNPGTLWALNTQKGLESFGKVCLTPIRVAAEFTDVRESLFSLI